MPPQIVDYFFKLILAIGCVGFCLAVGLVYLIYRFAYKVSTQPPPAPDNDENSED